MDELADSAYRAAMMPPSRTLTSSEAKASLGEVLGTLVSEGPVEITRNGRLVAVISAPMEEKPADTGRLASMAALYSAGKVTWRHVADETGASFGDVLLELAKQNLVLPRVNPDKTPLQANRLKAIFRKAAER